MSEPSPLRHTPLVELHRELGGRLVDFAGWELPVRYDPGPVAEHLHTRSAASLFDVSHMGIVEVGGRARTELAAALERLVPADLDGLKPGAQRYTMFTNDQGGIIDDVIVASTGEYFTLVVNASRRSVDLDHLRRGLGDGIDVVERDDLALLAVQGPLAVEAVATLVPGAAELGFMQSGVFAVAGVSCRVSRSGYTGEDGFELQVPGSSAEQVARALLALPVVEPAGLAARDSLRLEAGLCLYGNDLDESTTPIEAGLAWTIPGRRRGAGGFPGADVIRSQLSEGPPRMRVGLRTEGRQPVRAGTELQNGAGIPVGVVCSGGYGPTFGGPIAQAYVTPASAAPETSLVAIERGKELAVVVTSMPFVTRRYHRDTSVHLHEDRS
jgi:aminomethyltransferase